MADESNNDLVPVIDLSLPDSAAALLVRSACTSVGFFHISNHGVSQDFMDKTFSESRKLFALPLEEKKKVVADRNNRGWTPLQDQTLDPAHQTQGDTKEGFYFGREVSKGSEEAKKPLHGPNQWPDPSLVPNLRPTFEAYIEAMKELCFRLLRILALSLDLSPSYFHPLFDPPIIVLRPLHYQGRVSEPSNGIFGAGAHTDWGMLTVLATDGTPGLQIYQGGKWVDVNSIPGTFIINLGDMLERWTNKRYKSTIHRVVTTTEKERYSIAFFIEPAFDTVVECLPQCLGPDEEPRYPPITAGQYLLDKHATTHSGYEKKNRQLD